MTEVVDTFGRKHTYLRVSLTERCNLRCFYCMPEDGIDLTPRPHLMNSDELLHIVKGFTEMGIDTIRLTGGEPLVRKDFPQIVERLVGLPVALKLTTNGVLLDRYFDLFEKVGLRHINISLDSLDQVQSAFITKRDYFERIFRNMKTALGRGFVVKVNVVLIKGVNDCEIEDFIKLTKAYPLIVKFIEFMPFKGNQWNWEKGVSEEEILNQVSSAFGGFEELQNPKHSTSSNYKVKGFKGSFGIISTITKPFCGECNRLRLTADGKMKVCLFASNETDLLGALRQGQSITPLVKSAILGKKYSRDGMMVMTPDQYERNRSMVAIGG